MTELTAAAFTERLLAVASEEERVERLRYFKTGPGDYAEHDTFIGVRMGEIFRLAKGFIDLADEEIERLLDSPIHEVRAGALSIMDKRARRRSTTEEQRRALFELYLRRHDRIDCWDLVDLAAVHVVGRYLAERERGILDDLARSGDVWERRTAIMATLYFVRAGELDDTCRLAEALLHDEHDMVQKPVGALLRETGKHDRPRLLAFLDEHAASMPRTSLRYAMEHLDADTRRHYRARRDQEETAQNRSGRR